MQAIWFKLLPLYFFVFLGFLGGRYLDVKKESLAPVIIYLLTPILFFSSVMETPLSGARAWLPLLIFGVCSLGAVTMYLVGRLWFSKPALNILAFSAGNANSGYFGFPLAFLLFGENGLRTAILLALGFVFYENTVGFYIAARGRASAKAALFRLLKLPSLYAFALALMFKSLDVSNPTFIKDISIQVREAYSLLGMMIVGLGMVSIRVVHFDWKFLLGAFIPKFLMWPLFVMLLIKADVSYFHLFETDVQKSLFLVSTVPLAANTVAFASLLRAEPEKSSFAVLLSTLLSIVIIPFWLMFSP